MLQSFFKPGLIDLVLYAATGEFSGMNKKQSQRYFERMALGEDADDELESFSLDYKDGDEFK